VNRNNSQFTIKQKLNPKQYRSTTTILSIGIGLLACQTVEANDIQVGTENLTPSNDIELLQQLDRYDNDDAIGQVNSVSQLRDISPSDWAYEALRSLVENYGCIAGYPDATFRGNKPMNRYEFAAGLNACLNQIEQSIASGTAIVKEDLEKLQKLTEEFGTELATLRGKVDSLEQRIATLEEQQFSTTTKLTGEVVFGLAGILTGDDANGNNINSEAVFGHRTRLGFSTSFSGDDLLYFQLNSGNLPNFSRVTGTYEGNLGSLDNQSNNVNLLVAFYSLPIDDRTRIIIEGTGGYVFDFVDTISAFDKLNDSASGAISAFGLRNPIYNTVYGAGAGIQSQLNDNFAVNLGYLAPTAQEPSSGNGLFDGAYSAIGQVVFTPDDRFKIGFAYVRNYNSTDTFTGSNFANFRTFDPTSKTASNAFGLQTSWQLSSNFILGGWVGYTDTEVISSANGSGNFDTWNWAVTLAFPDLGKEGNLGGIVVGMEPKVTDASFASGFSNVDRDTSLHIEAFYQHQLNDNIAITPGIIWTTAPNHNSNNADTVLGILRTTFTF
jgi:hypothetical protein